MRWNWSVKKITVDDLVKELLKDRVFYQTSGGGVTFSGGEPLWQSGFIAQVARKLKAEGIHTILDTAGKRGLVPFRRSAAIYRPGAL